jgi:hypothetical protein
MNSKTTSHLGQNGMHYLKNGGSTRHATPHDMDWDPMTSWGEIIR